MIIYPGQYVNGIGQASKCCAQHFPVFNCDMKGTFNIKAPDLNINRHHPTLETETLNYYLIRIDSDLGIHFGWAVRKKDSSQLKTVLEICTRVLLPEALKTLPMSVQIARGWDQSRIDHWAKGQYWFQGHPWLKTQRVDSKKVWDKINGIDWRGQTVLDIGAHSGYFSWEIAKSGGIVTAFEPDSKCVQRMCTIREKIELQDIDITQEDPGGTFDTILYLSVHHQPDPTYKNLKAKIQELTSRARQWLFVELILPPMFPMGGGMTSDEMNEIVGGEILTSYHHKIRGVRRIYKIKGEADAL